MRHYLTILLLLVTLSNCDKKTELLPIPTANFSYDCGTCLAPCEVIFTNKSKDASAYKWDFGDGESSTEANPKHVYKQKGSYLLKLLAINESGESSIEQELILGQGNELLADFSIPAGDLYAPGEVIFTNQSQNATTYLWTFGDGTESSDPSPKHIYTQKGVYTVTLYASGTGGNSQVSKTVEMKSKDEINLDNVAVILEYNSLWDIHTKPDYLAYPNIRIQPDNWDYMRVLSDLSKIVHPETYDFILCYTLQEVPHWKNSGPKFEHAGNNLGFVNTNTPLIKPTGWNKLRAMPHMNSLGFTYPIPGTVKNYNTSITAFHEMAHFWGVFITAQDSVGPRNWKPEYPIAWLAAGDGHWSWVFKEHNGIKMPGILYSGPLDRIFNDFDLYIMGLMGYAEASKTVYTIYENEQPDKTHNLRLDDLIAALNIAGPVFYWGDGKRIPDKDESVKQMNVLIVLVKGKDEVLTADHKFQLLKIKQDVDADWQIVTKNLSQISTVILRR